MEGCEKYSQAGRLKNLRRSGRFDQLEYYFVKLFLFQL